MEKYRSYYFRHKLISFLRDIDLKGFRRLSVALPNILLPKAAETEPYVLKTTNNLLLWIDPRQDHGVELSLHQTGTYEKGVLHFMQEYLKQGDTFLDIGANIGLMSLFASRLVGDTGRVLAFEAHPETALLLKNNLQRNAVSNIQVFDFALGSTRSQSYIYNSTDNRGGASLIASSSQAQEIEVYPLDDVVSEDVLPSMIKIDVEGFELEVLKGAESTILRSKPILIIEISQERHVDRNITMDLMEYLKELNLYRFYKLKGGKERKSVLLEVKSNEDLPLHDNIFCLPK